MLVLRRARLAKVLDGDNDARAGKVPCQRNGLGAGAAAGGHGNGGRRVLARVISLEILRDLPAHVCCRGEVPSLRINVPLDLDCDMPHC